MSATDNDGGLCDNDLCGDGLCDNDLCEESCGDGRDAEVPAPAWGAPRWRLYSLRGMPCPLCRRAPARTGRSAWRSALAWTGVSLACPRGHGWSNADALRTDLLAEVRGPGWEAAGDDDAP